jgi:hypothetical protein
MILLASVIAAFTPPLQASDALLIQPGERIVFHLEDSGDHTRPVEVRRGAKVSPSQAGEMVADLSIQAGGTVLVIASNSTSFFSYRAQMALPNGRSEATSVCSLMSRARPSVEGWPYPVKALALHDFRPIAGETMVCQ